MRIKKPLSLEIQIKKFIGNRILYCSFMLIILVFAQTIYDFTIGIHELRSKINDQMRPTEYFVISQIMLNNVDGVYTLLKNIDRTNSAYHVTWNPYAVPEYNGITWKPPFNWVYDYQLGEIAGYQFGYFRITGSILSDQIISDFALHFVILSLFILAVLGYLLPLAKKIPEALFLSPINHCLDLISKNDQENQIPVDFPIELQNLEAKILHLLQKVKEHERHQAAIEIGYLAAQVAHDLHSPLVSLQSFVKENAIKFPEADRIFLRSVLRRLNDTTISLLSKYKADLNVDVNKRSYVFVVVCILEAIYEKRVELGERNFEFTLNVKNEIDNFAVVFISPSEFKRVLSNLLNNAIKATLEQEGIIELTFESTFLGSCVSIKDYGIGINSIRINDLLSTNPSNDENIGLGLRHAKKYLDEINGKLKILSEEGVGTTVQIYLPLNQEPSWLITNCYINDRTIIIVDDDQMIHEVWQRKLNELEGIRSLHFISPSEFLDFCSKNSEEKIIFCDYEFFNSKMTGIDLLKQVNNSYLKILVTSHYDEELILKACEENNFKLLPKRLVAYFDIIKHTKINYNTEKLELIFIDDKKYNTDDWEFFAKDKKIKIATFNSLKEFYASSELFSREIPIYIDYDLNPNEKNGIDAAQDIFNMGFKEIYLATGYAPKFNVSECYWIKGVVDKEPPFLHKK